MQATRQARGEGTKSKKGQRERSNIQCASWEMSRTLKDEQEERHKVGGPWGGWHSRPREPPEPSPDTCCACLSLTRSSVASSQPADAKNWLIGKDPDAGNDWKQEEKGTIEDEMVGWHHRLNGHEFEQALGDGDGQGSLACCGPWGHKESDMTEPLN